MNIAALDILADYRTLVAAESYQLQHEGMVAPPWAQPTNILTVDIHTAIDSCIAEWENFERLAVGTLYQSSLWCRAWTETVGKSLNVSPRIAVVRNAAGRIQMILPLQIRRRQGVRVLEWLGTPHHNYGFGLFHCAFMQAAETWFVEGWDRLLNQIGGFDAVALTEMPIALLGHANPMRQLGNLRSANPSFFLALKRGFESLYAERKSAERRRAARKHENGLAQAGTVRFGLPEDAAATRELIDTMFRLQEARLAELGILGVFGPELRNFMQRLAELQDAENPILAPYALWCDDQVLAITLGGLHGNMYWALVSSLAPGPLRKFSPGDLALRRTIEACCQRGLSGFDFSAGDQPYKRGWTDDVIEMTNAIRGTNLRGILWAGVQFSRLAAKRAIKRSPVLFPLTQALRRAVWGKSVS